MSNYIRMNFSLLVSNANHFLPRDEQDVTISEALQTIYPYTKEASVYMYWNGYILELYFCAEISDLIQDIFFLINSLGDKKQFRVNWGSNIFFGTWDCLSDGKYIKIKSDLQALRGGSETLKQLSHVSNEVTIQIDTFTKEWLKLLKQIKKDLERNGYNRNNLKDFILLESIIQVASKRLNCSKGGLSDEH